jgi:hypothetical protein
MSMFEKLFGGRGGDPTSQPEVAKSPKEQPAKELAVVAEEPEAPYRLDIIPRSSEGNGSFLDIDWHRVFSGDMQWSYPRPYREKYLSFLKPDGTIDQDAFAADESASRSRLNEPLRYLDPEGHPRMDDIIADLNRQSISYERLLLAVPDASRLEQADRHRLHEALIQHINFLIGRGKVAELFECLENVVPVYFESFKIVEDALPKMVRHPYIDAIPIYSSSSMYGKRSSNIEAIRKALAAQFPGEEDELCEQIQSNPDLLFFWRELSSRRSFPRKQPTTLQGTAAVKKLPADK